MAGSELFTPFNLGALPLRNRVVRTAAFEGMCPEGEPSEALIEHHRRIAQGGVAMTTVAYCSVSPDGRTFAHQMVIDERIAHRLERLTDAVHREGAAVSLQLGHSGFFASRKVIGVAPLGPSRCFNTFGLSFSEPMTEAGIDRVTGDFEKAACLARDAGFDAVELHLGHGYLLSQFLSPHTNKRKDRFGGALENRMRFPLEVFRRVKHAVGPGFPVLAKVNLEDGFSGGLEPGESIEVARRLEEEGADALVLSGGFVSKTPLYMLRGKVPLKEMIAVEDSRVRKVGLAIFGKIFVRAYPFSELFFLEKALLVRAAVKMPLVLVGGICTRAGMETAMLRGFDLIAIGRALIEDPDFVRKIEAGEIDASPCDHCNACIAEMDRGGIRCVLPGRNPPR